MSKEKFTEKELVAMAVILTRKDQDNISYQDYAWAENNFPSDLSPRKVIDDLFTKQ